MSEMERTNFQTWAPSAQSYDPLAFAKLKADGVNKVPGNLTGTDCPKCRNKGYVMIPRDDGSIASQECDCMTMRRCVWRMERSGLKDVIKNYTFDRFETTEAWQKKILESATEYAKGPEGWFLICGQSGSGKSHICTAICRELLLKGKQVVYAAWRQEIAEIKAMSLDADRRADKLNELKTAEILYIDDLFKTGAGKDGEACPTSADVSLAFEIINARYTSRRPTIISTEFFPDQLLKMDEATGGRMIEMAKNHTLAVGKKPGRNYRLRGVVAV